MERPRLKLIQAIFRDTNGRPLPDQLPEGYRTASLRFLIPKGSVASRPAADSRFLPIDAHRERGWLAYADALNSDTERSINDLGSFPNEYRSLFEGRTSLGFDVAAFAERWGLRQEDLVVSLRLSESRWHQTGDVAGFEPPQRLPFVPVDTARTIVGEVKVDYDPTEMTRSQARDALDTELGEVRKRFSSAFEQIEKAAARRGLRQIPSLHRSWEDLLRIARRRVRRKKGWTWNAIATADHVAVRVAQQTVRRFEELLAAEGSPT